MQLNKSSQIVKVDYVSFICELCGEKLIPFVFLLSMVKTKNLVCQFVICLLFFFLPPEEIPSAFFEIKELLEIESGMEYLIIYFENNYVLSRVRKTLRKENLVEDYHYFHQNCGLFLIRIF